MHARDHGGLGILVQITACVIRLGSLYQIFDLHMKEFHKENLRHDHLQQAVLQ